MSVKHIVQVHFITTSALLKNIVFIEEWMFATKETKRHRKNNIFGNNYIGSHSIFELLFY